MARYKSTPYIDEEPGYSVAPDGNARVNLQEADKRRKQLTEYYKNEEKVPIYLSPMYAPYVGRVMRVMINGISIYFKVDGSTQMVPKTFADEITSRRIAIDATITRQAKMANIGSNHETAPGELKLF